MSTQLLMVAVESGHFDGYKLDFIFHQQGMEGGIVTYKDAMLGVNKVEKPFPVKSLQKAKGHQGKQSPRSNKQVSFNLKTPRSAKVSETAGSIDYQHVLNQNHGSKLNPGGCYWTTSQQLTCLVTQDCFRTFKSLTII